MGVRYRRERSIVVDDALSVHMEEKLNLKPKDKEFSSSASSSSISTVTSEEAVSPSDSSTSSPTNSNYICKYKNVEDNIDILDNKQQQQKTTSTLSLDTLPSDCLISILSYLKVTDIQRCYTSCRSLHCQNEVMLQVILEVDRYREKGFAS